AARIVRLLVEQHHSLHHRFTSLMWNGKLAHGDTRARCARFRIHFLQLNRHAQHRTVDIQAFAVVLIPGLLEDEFVAPASDIIELEIPAAARERRREDAAGRALQIYTNAVEPDVRLRIRDDTRDAKGPAATGAHAEIGIRERRSGWHRSPLRRYGYGAEQGRKGNCRTGSKQPEASAHDPPELEWKQCTTGGKLRQSEKDSRVIPGSM